MGQLDVLVNCAGILAYERLISEGASSVQEGSVQSEFTMHSLATYERILKTNLDGSFYAARTAARLMCSKQDEPGNSTFERGVIINIGSVHGFEQGQRHLAYGISKAAVHGMTLAMARDLGPYKVRVVCIAPGAFDTNMARTFLTPETQQETWNQTPLHRSGTANPEFALFVKQVVQNRFWNGNVLRYDGNLIVGN